MSDRPRLAVVIGSIGVIGTAALASVAPVALAGPPPSPDAVTEGRTSRQTTTHPSGLETWLARIRDWGLVFELAYTGDYLANTRGGVARRGEFLGNLDLTVTWHSDAAVGRDLGTFFLYGLYDHGGRPSDNVGDLQIVDNIEAPDAVQLYEAWWQKSFLAERASLLVGLYDVNSEFYLVESALVFIHSSFGMGAALGNSGVNGPSIFPATSLGARLKAELVPGWEVQAAVLDGVPGDPERAAGTRVRFGEDDGVFAIAEVAHAWRPTSDESASSDVLRTRSRRRAMGRRLDVRPYAFRVAAGTWVYSARRDHVSRVLEDGDPDRERGHPGLYLTADLDASRLDPFESGGLAVFLQAGLADEDVEPFQGYLGGGLTLPGLLPGRDEDVLGFGVAAAFVGNGLDRALRNDGARPASAEIALEWTYRAPVLPWLTLQGDLQHIVNPGGRRSRPDALVAGIRFIVSP